MLRNSKIFNVNLIFKRHSMAIGKEKIKTTFMKEDHPPIDVPDVPISKYGGETIVTLLTGSKVGKEGAEYIKAIFEHIHAPIDLEYLSRSKEEIVPNEFLLSVMRNGTALFIDATHESKTKQKSLHMNTQLDLYACVVNCFSIPGYSCLYPGTDIAIVMQNNRGDYSKLEYEPVKGVVETLKITDKRSAERYIDFAFRYAIRHKRKRITFGHKSNEVPLYDSMHVEAAKKIHQKYPTIDIDFMLINKLSRYLVWDPARFDVLCLNDNYGTFVTAVVSGVCGGASLFSSSELGDNHAIFKPLQTKLSLTGGSAPLCPYGTISTATTLLQHLGYHECASMLWRGLMKVMVLDNIKTAEFGGNNSEEEVICKLLNVLQQSACQHH